MLIFTYCNPLDVVQSLDFDMGDAFSELLNYKENIFLEFGLVWTNFDLINELIFVVVDDGNLLGLDVRYLGANAFC